MRFGTIALAIVMGWFKVAAQAVKQSGHRPLLYCNERIVMALLGLSEALFGKFLGFRVF